MRAEARVWIAVLSLGLVAACGTSGPESTQRTPSTPAPVGPASTTPVEPSPEPAPAPAPAATGLADFAGIAQLQALFDQHRDAAQLVLLLSPT